MHTETQPDHSARPESDPYYEPKDAGEFLILHESYIRTQIATSRHAKTLKGRLDDIYELVLWKITLSYQNGTQYRSSSGVRLRTWLKKLITRAELQYIQKEWRSPISSFNATMITEGGDQNDDPGAEGDGEGFHFEQLISDQYVDHVIVKTVADAETIDWRLAVSGEPKVAEAILRLREDWRTILALKYVGGFTNVEIAGLLHKPLGTIKRIEHNAIEKLQREFLGNVVRRKTGGNRSRKIEDKG